MKAPVCSHPILQYAIDIGMLKKEDFFLRRHIKHLGPNRFDLERTIAQTRNNEQSRSLPRIPFAVCPSMAE